MEIYNGEASTVDVKLPDGSSAASAVIKKDGSVIYTPMLPNPAIVDNVVSVPIPYIYTVMDSDLTVEVTFTLGTNAGNIKAVPVRIVTPLLTLQEISEILPTASDSEMKRVERKVRAVIENNTGQYFGKYDGTLRVYGGDSSILNTSKRVISVSSLSFTGGEWTDGLGIINDGWSISRLDRGWIKVDTFQEGDVYRSGPVIYDPRATFLFSKNVEYSITGLFGYDYVPYDIKEAARALINDYACAESLYRDRYLADIRAADWRFSFDTGAYLGTGNVVADQLISGYRRNILAVI